jgi:hypothetical protein
VCRQFAGKIKLRPEVLVLPSPLPVLADLAWIDRRLATIRCRLNSEHMEELGELLSEFPSVKRVQLNLHDMWLTSKAGKAFVECCVRIPGLMVSLGVHDLISVMEFQNFTTEHTDCKGACYHPNCILLLRAKVSIQWVTVHDPRCGSCIKEGFVGGHVPEKSTTIWKSS